MFLAEDEVRTLFQRVADHMPRGEFVFTSYSSLVKQREIKRGRRPFFQRHDISQQWTYRHRSIKTGEAQFG